MNDSYRSAPLLIYANKQDLPGCMTVAEIGEILKLNENKMLAERPVSREFCLFYVVTVEIVNLDLKKN